MPRSSGGPDDSAPVPLRGAGSRPRGRITQDSIVAAAISLLDAEGADALTMRRLGATFAVEGMALYRYFPNKDAILDAAVTTLFGMIDVPETASGDGFADVRGIMLSFYDVVQAHPSFRDLLIHGASLPASQNLFRTGVALLESEGLSPEAAADALGSLVAYALGSIFQAKSPYRDDPLRTFKFGLDAILKGFRAGAEKISRD